MSFLVENAAITYEPDEESTSLQAARDEAERQLGHLENIVGIGMSQTLEGEDAVIVYVKTRETLAQLPTHISGVPVIGEVTGEVRAL
ncbi:hypothetical protein [Adonisia turfae]|uniref:Uncharacterized protein n=1 Tax=Adonisia turfae CCMR0081 TaxID=2292702 RepID=A0A6M0RFV7_9CYAN|nr:hypothetical protein [Adonisia turfae]NEZ55029.1 hypothetical protein [Adonisia turfae CCMR0081]